MNEHELPPLDKDVLDLLAAESRVAPPPGSSERVFDATVARIRTRSRGDGGGDRGGGGAGPGGAASLARRAGLLVASFVAGATSATIAYSLLRPTPPPAPPIERIVYVDRAPPPADAGGESPARATPDIDVTPPPSAPESSAEAPNTFAAERALLDVARAAFAGGDASAALAAVDRHAQRFPRGQLSEEREAIAIKALAMAGRTEEARARAARFRERYPRSVMMRSIDSWLEKTR